MGIDPRMMLSATDADEALPYNTFVPAIQAKLPHPDPAHIASVWRGEYWATRLAHPKDRKVLFSHLCAACLHHPVSD